MTIVDGRHTTCVHVGSKLMEQILLNISPDCLNRVIGKTATPSSSSVKPFTGEVSTKSPGLQKASPVSIKVER